MLEDAGARLDKKKGTERERECLCAPQSARNKHRLPVISFLNPRATFKPYAKAVAACARKLLAPTGFFNKKKKLPRENTRKVRRLARGLLRR